MNNWKDEDLNKLEAVLQVSLQNVNQLSFLEDMRQLACIGISPSEKQLKYLHFLWLRKVSTKQLNHA